MTADRGRPARQDLAARWAARPGSYSRSVWALMLALRRLPWPWGEEILAGCFMARTLARPLRLHQALAWASAQSDHRESRWRVARGIAACEGRFIARSALLGMRDPERLHRHVAVRGADRLAAGRGLILLGFHLGPPGAYLVLRAAGHRVTFLGGRGGSGLWAPEIQERYTSLREDLFFSPAGSTLGKMSPLYRARQTVRDGGIIFVNADGRGKEAFSVPVPGGRAIIRAGWLTLRRATNAPVFPVLSHLEGRTHVVTVHPPLPSLDPEPASDLDRCRRALEALLADYVRQFPEQCYSLAFPRAPRGDAAGSATSPFTGA